LKTYKLGPLAYQQLKRRLLRVGGLVIVSVFVVNIITTAVSALASQNEPLLSQLGITIGALVIVAVAIVVVFYFQLQSQKRLLESVEVQVGPDSISRQQLRIPKIELQRQEIRAGEEMGGALLLRTEDKYRSLAIPQSIEGYQEIRDTVASWNIPIRSTERRSQLVNVAIGIGALAGFAVMIFGPNFWFALVGLVGLLALYGYLYWFVRKTQGVDPKYRRNMLYILLLILLIGGTRIAAFYFMTQVPRP
jgi:hypothetical protein